MIRPIDVPATGGVSARPFTFASVVHYDELDAMNMLHNTRYAVHVERAVIAFFNEIGSKWEREISSNPDQFHAVREFSIEFLAPVAEVGPLHVEVWAERVGNSSCTHAFMVRGADGRVVHARGRRSIVKLNPATLRPSAWSEAFRRHNEALLFKSAASEADPAW
jgi:acyl-CoA thioester hydrolase